MIILLDESFFYVFIFMQAKHKELSSFNTDVVVEKTASVFQIIWGGGGCSVTGPMLSALIM